MVPRTARSAPATSASVRPSATIAAARRSARPSAGRARRRAGGVLEREHAGDVGGGQLALRVADRRRRARPPGRQQRRQRHLHREQRRLRDSVRRSSRGALGPAAQVCSSEQSMRGTGLLAGLIGGGEDRGAVAAARCPCRPAASPGRGTRRRACGGAAGGPLHQCRGRARRRQRARGRPAAPRARSRRTTARRGSAARVVAREAATSRGSSSGWPRRCSASRPACSRRAASVLAESRQRRQGRPTPGRCPGRARSALRHRRLCGSSRITWALVPLMPNEETPARRGCVAGSPGPGLGEQPTRPADQSTCGVGSSTCRVGGSTPCADRQRPS